MKKIVSLVFILLTLAACNREDRSYAKAWLISKNSLGEDYSDEDIADAVKAGKRKTEPPSDCFINLKSGGQYSSYFVDYRQGQWEVKNNRLVLTPEKGREMQFEIKSINDNEMVLLFEDLGVSYTFKGFSNKFDSDQDDPFSAANNKWRIKAAGKESEAQIRQRLRNYLSFMEKYFAFGAKEENPGVPAGVVAGPLNMHGNGVGLPEFQKQPIVWREHFYDEEDGRKAYSQMDDYMRQNNVLWQNTSNKYESFSDAFRQMKEWVK
jgi:hypothetical protein